MDKTLLQNHLDNCLTISGKRVEQTLCINYSSLFPSKNPNSPSESVQHNSTSNNGQTSKSVTPSQETFTTSEMDVLIFISESKYLQELLTHPTLATYILLRWQRVSQYYYINLIFYFLLFVFLHLHMFLQYINEDYDTYCEGVKQFGIFVYFLNILLLIALIVREICQLYFYHFRYFNNVENYIEIIIIVSMGFMLFYNPDPQAESTILAIAAIATLFSTLELFFLIGQYPKLSTNMAMLRIVSINFIKFLLFFTLPICAFALCFYVLFSRVPADPNDNSIYFFVNPLTSLVKIFIMLTGELDASNFKFETNPIISYILFVLFIFIIPMVLLNLLNGLAVSDIQQIKNDTEMYSYTTKIRTTVYIETMILAYNSRIEPERWWRKFYDSAIRLCCSNTFIRQKKDNSQQLDVDSDDRIKAKFEGDSENYQTINGIDKNVIKMGKNIVVKKLAKQRKHEAKNEREREERLQMEHRNDKMWRDIRQEFQELAGKK